MAMILDAFVGTFVEKLTSVAKEKVVMVLGVNDELKKLQQRMLTIQKFLEAAERRQLEDPVIKHWVGRLKDAAYDADDIIDRCIIEGTALSLADRPSSSKKLAVCFDFSLLFACFASVPHRYEIAKSIKLLDDNLEEICKDMSRFNFEARREQPELQKITTVNIRQTSPLVDVDVMGTEIEEAAKELVKLIVVEQAEKCRVIALTGMGGIGKTTLAQKIYNNEKIQTEFQNKVWVCISQNYDEIELLRQVIVKGAEGNHDDTRNETELLPKNKTELLPLLQSTYHGKSLFLVLDDVWRVDVWIKLFRSPLQSAVFLRILVTTRDENIARGMKAAHTHPVKQLSDQIGWDILCKKVFLDGEETEIGKLKDIGLQIVKKCSGLPLAINAIAGVLAKKEKSRREWEKVLKNDAWSMKKLPQELEGGLYLSYDDLPSNLKQCFLYFSLFPEDALIDRDDLVRLWLAEGFVEEQNDSLVEDVAEEYYIELLRRNLLQVSSFKLLSNAWEYKIHDLMRTLAKFLSQDEIFSGMTLASTTPSSSTKLRRLSIETPESLLAIKDLVVEQKCLRTLLTFNGINVLNDIQLVGLEHLRVLRLKNVDINNIPDSIGDMIHLRYLNLSGTKIRALPESIGSLINLQFLDLSECIFLTTLPKSICRLHNLRCLDLMRTPLNSIPKGISKLEKINCFYKFVVADPREPEDSYTSLEELLNSLCRLRVLRIYRLERARSGALGLQKLTRLIHLELLYSKIDRALTTEEDITRIEDALEELCPPQCLEGLTISNFFGTHYPSWMKSSSFGHRLPYLISLQCSISCPQLPPVGELPQLTNLVIHEANSVKSIGSEFLGAGVCDIHTTTRTAFPNLQLFILGNMPELEEWSFNNETEGFEHGRGMMHVLPHLKELIIIDCPKLKALPKGLELCKIKKLHIKEANSLKEVENLHTVEEMKIVENQNLERVSNLPALYKLQVEECPSLNCVEKLDSLQRLELIDYNMKEIPKYLERLLEERKPANVNDVFCIKITTHDTTLLRFLKGGPDWPIIAQIPQFIAYNRKGILVMRYTKNPFTYTTYDVPE